MMGLIRSMNNWKSPGSFPESHVMMESLNFSSSGFILVQAYVDLVSEGDQVEVRGPSGSVDVVGVQECRDPLSERGCCRTEIGLVSCSRVAGDVVLWNILESPCT